jgi:phosphoenolpyruvate carboxykinase (GTP)
MSKILLLFFSISRKGIMTSNLKLKKWVDEMAAMCQPDSIVWCDGSKAEYDGLIKNMVDSGLAKELNQSKLPG